MVGNIFKNHASQEPKKDASPQFTTIKQIGENVFEWEQSTSAEHSIQSTKDKLLGILGNQEIIEKLTQAFRLPPEKLAIFWSHIEKYKDKSLQYKDHLIEKLSLPANYVTRSIKILLVALTLMGMGKMGYDKYVAYAAHEKKEVRKHAPAMIDLTELAGYGQTRLTLFHGALADASDSKIFQGKHTLYLESTPEQAIRQVDYKQNLKRLWEHKFAKNKQAAGMAAMTGVYERAIKPFVESDQAFTEYSLDAWTKDIEYTINKINKNIDRAKVCSKTGIKTSHAHLLEKVFSRMKSEHILSYTCTEVFGDLPSDFSIAYLDFLFRHGGQEYVYYIPAVYDKLASFGPYQLTSSVVRHDDEVKGSANTIQEALPKELRTIPGSMYKLTPQQQNEATYLNMIYNFALMINILEKNKVSPDFSNVDMGSVLEYLAMSHHYPRVATKAAVHWMKDHQRNDYTSYVTGKWKKYPQRTQGFYKAAQKYYKNKSVK